MKLADLINDRGTRARHAEGSKLNLDDNGNYLLIVGSDSDIGQQAQWEIARMDKTNSEAVSKLRAIYAGFIIDWSLEEKITHKKAVKLLEEVPSLLAEIISFIQDSGNFTKP